MILSVKRGLYMSTNILNFSLGADIFFVLINDVGA